MIKNIVVLVLLFNVLVFSQVSESLIKGVDISFTPLLEDGGGEYKLNGTATDPLQIYSVSGVNYVRLRLWHTPSDKYSGLQNTLEFAKRVKKAGFKLLLDFHYSDWWADPGKQTKPAAWKDLPYSNLVDSVYSYTYRVMKLFSDNNALPEIVQTGNEITPGFLWPEGRIGGSYDSQQQRTQFTSLLKNAVKAVRDASPSTKIMIHIDRGGNNTTSRWFYDILKSYSVEYDIIGLSFYPWWHGTLTALRNNVNDLAYRYGKEIIVAETAYPWTLQWYDQTGNIVGSSGQLHKGYSSSVEGQYSFIYDLFQVVRDIPNSKGLGVFYWEPGYISVPGIGSPWENLALFDFQGNTLNSARVFNDVESDTSNAVNVTFTLNTATNYDTLKPSGYVQLRGELVDKPDDLASGEKLTWDINSEVLLLNENGDYWQTTVRLTPGTEILYKYWTGHSKTKPTFLRLGSEGPIETSFRRFTAGTADTVLPVEYYNSTANTLNQYWSPFIKKADSAGIMFRVNTSDLLKAGTFNPAGGESIILGGDSLSSAGVLSRAAVISLTKEQYSIAGESFWSGVVYFPKNEISSGTAIPYRFGIQKSGSVLWEDVDRSFSLPVKDSTLYWVFFNDRKTVTRITDDHKMPESFILYPNYPNPFNPETTIKYYIPERIHTEISLYDFTGRKIRTLFSDNSSEGINEVQWNGRNDMGESVSSGIYFVRLTAGGYSGLLKIMLLK